MSASSGSFLRSSYNIGSPCSCHIFWSYSWHQAFMPLSFYSFDIRCCTVEWYISFPLAFNIFWVIAGPMSIAKPRSHPRTNCSSGKGIEESWYITHLYHLNKANGEISVVSPLMIVSRTWPLRLKISRVVQERIYDSLSKQWSQRPLGALDQTISCPSPCFSSWMANSAEFDHGVCGSVCLT